MLPWKLGKRHILPVNQNLSSVSFFFFTCQVSAFEPQPFSCHDLAKAIYSQTAKTVFSHLKMGGKSNGDEVDGVRRVGGVNIQEIGNRKET